MEFPTSEIVGLIYQLLPGFIAAWIFYGLTAHPQKTPFERVVQALIFTGIVKALIYPIRFVCILLGKLLCNPPPWSTEGEYFLSVLFAVVMGFVFTYYANSNAFHDWLPERISKRTSYPSEWFSTFNQFKRFVYLHLKDGRRLYGWPTEFPDSPTAGYFVLERPEWIADDNTQAPLLTVEKMLVPATEVVMVEFEKEDHELKQIDGAKHQQAVEAMVAIQKPNPSQPETDVDKQTTGSQDEVSLQPKPQRKRATRRKPKDDGTK